MAAHDGTTISLAVDVGGTFSDIALSVGGVISSQKVLTNNRAPEVAVMEACEAVLRAAGQTFADVGLFIHGTTLATNALIERRGARTAVLATQGHRDTLDLGFEDRFSEYDLFIERPPALVPRDLRFTVPERVSARGEVLLPLDEDAVHALAPELGRLGIESLSIGFLHAYANPAHEMRARDILGRALPDVAISISAEVCPEIREYERLSTTVANAYVQPLMAGYLGRLAERLTAAGLGAPLFLMLSDGGLATLETARAFPIRLIESGPAGGAILAAHIAAQCDLPEVVSFDMGGTTAKICLISDGAPTLSRSFEVGRVHRFLKGSGLPLRVPVIEMVEIGAGGGSIASVDAMNRVRVGPESAAADPGPACYDRGGVEPTVTDADVTAGRVAPDGFAGGSIRLRPDLASAALQRRVGDPLGLSDAMAALAVSEIVDENMANAARVHAIEEGRTIERCSIVAFGGAGPVHAARLAQKTGAGRIVVPPNAGVGSAVGFLLAPLSYTIAQSRYMRLSAFDAEAANALLADMSARAAEPVRLGAPEAPMRETRSVEARYSGQGHELTLELPLRPFTDADGPLLLERFSALYAERYGRAVEGMAVEIINWTVSVTAASRAVVPAPAVIDAPVDVAPAGHRDLFDAETQAFVPVPVYHRAALPPGARLSGPALIVEDQTTTVAPALFDVTIDARRNIVMTRRAETGPA